MSNSKWMSPTIGNYYMITRGVDIMSAEPACKWYRENGIIPGTVYDTEEHAREVAAELAKNSGEALATYRILKLGVVDVLEG